MAIQCVNHQFHYRDPLGIYIFAVFILTDVANSHLPLVAANLLLFVVYAGVGL